jgi:hypothetical protein
MRRLLFVPLIAAALSAVPSAASAVTLKEIVELTRAGLSDDILLALIEIDPRVYPVDPETLRMLKESGVSERVIIAMVKSGRTPPPQPPVQQPPIEMMTPPPPPEPEVVVVERPVVREVAVAVPVYVPVPVVPVAPVVVHPSRVVDPSRALSDYDLRGVDRLGVGFDRLEIAQPKRAEPVYWGWGGKRRPDSWPVEQPRPSKSSNERR